MLLELFCHLIATKAIMSIVQHQCPLEQYCDDAVAMSRNADGSHGYSRAEARRVDYLSIACHRTLAMMNQPSPFL